MAPPAKTQPSIKDLHEWLGPSATTSERVRGLLEIGLHAAEVAGATGVSVSGLRNWGSGAAEPRPGAAITLDDLRAVAKILLDGKLDPERVANWLRSWNPKLCDRPLGVVAERPMEVRSAAHGEVFDEELQVA